MKRLLLIPLLLFASCQGVRVRNEALLPVMYAAYTDSKSEWNGTGIYWDIRRGIKAKEREAGVAQELRLLADDLGDALKSGDYLRVIRIDWPRLRALALLGIADRVLNNEIGEGVALSFTERVVQFSDSFRILREK